MGIGDAGWQESGQTVTHEAGFECYTIAGEGGEGGRRGTRGTSGP